MLPKSVARSQIVGRYSSQLEGTKSWLRLCTTMDKAFDRHSKIDGERHEKRARCHSCGRRRDQSS